jgi:tetratricopeptide (TPR) repeat protein
MRISSVLLFTLSIAGLALGIWANQGVSNILFETGYSQSMSAKPADAIRSYDAAITMNPKHAPAFLNRGASKAAIGQLKGALADCDQAISLGGSDEFLFGAHYIRSSVRKNSGDFDGALADLNKAIELNGSEWSALHERGLLLAETGDKTGAIADFTEAIRLHPNAESFAARGYELDHVDDGGALADYDQALALDPENISALYGRSYARLRLGDKDGAIADLKELVKHETPCAAQLKKLLNSFSARNFQPNRTHSGRSCGTDIA